MHSRGKINTSWIVSLFLLLSLCSIETVVATPQTPEAAKEENCDDHPKLWQNDKGNPVRLSQKQLKQRVIHCETPKLPDLMRLNTIVRMQSLIGLEGTVECAKAIGTHPAFIREIAEQAAKNWTFKPVTHNNEPVTVSTILMMYVSWDYDNAHRRNCGAK